MINLYVMLAASSGGEAMVVGICVGLVSMAGLWLFNTAKDKITEIKIKKDPYDVKSLEKSAETSLEKGDLEKTISRLEQVKRIDKDHFVATAQLGIMYHNDKKYLKAKETLEPLLDIEKFEELDLDALLDHFDLYALALYRLGHLYFMEGNQEKAEQYKQLAIQSNKSVAQENLY